MSDSKIYRFQTITQIHRLLGIPDPEHPLISVIDLKGQKVKPGVNAAMFDFYAVTLKRGCDNLLYGQQKYDFDGGLMAFMAPGQILRGENGGQPENIDGWMMYIHPDFLWGTSLGKNIKKYDYFGYAANEALFLSDKEESIINAIVQNVITEYRSNIDKFSQDIIISHLETLLNYAERFYQRQFLTRKKNNHQVLERLEDLMMEYFDSEDILTNGLPTVQYMSDKLNISPGYLRSLLKTLTGMSTQNYIHEKLIEKAKEKLSTTELTVSEIAYDLGFEHPQSFSKLFKNKTGDTPLEFRQSFH